jgi:hypothetical protein
VSSLNMGRPLLAQTTSHISAIEFNGRNSLSWRPEYGEIQEKEI